ncbi:Pimeloyl-ACP methyl ester carboxylesterase [Roseovarius azorensis]|uniref:Pimeloyl-ACP methyl ester carboxylesterase n=1 Tax=Roseovarius azorensis TaxID=1287727 RepID=A0A1H7KIL5_9RHOB|nr:alpha/beta hydrolase [Roseovarius azorensis]SEK86701.1 Pimeloyl-ACP methyl ester carboxylesterase [Roseovarius azorensis]
MTWTTRPRFDLGDGLSGIVAGSGALVLLIHGVGLRAEAWAPQIDALSRYFRVIAADLPGHGKSRLGAEAALEDYTARLARALNHPAVVIGHSMGAMIALDLARTVPGRVRGVAALNAIFRRGPEAKTAVQARAEYLSGAVRPDPEPTLRRWFGAADTEARRICRTWLEGVDAAGYRAAYGVFAREDGPSDATLRGLRCPALFMTGGQEPNSTPAMSEAMAALAPRGRVEVVSDAAHMMPMTHSAGVSERLLRFVKECQNDDD